MAVAEEIRHAVELCVSLAASLSLCISCVAWKLEAINNFRRCHVRSILKVVGRISVTQLTSMARQWGPERYFKGFATFAADEQRKREEKRDREKRRKEKDEGMQPRMYDCSFFEVLEKMGKPYSKSWKKNQNLLSES